MKLNMGCGFNKLDGFVNIDRHPECQPDRVIDLETLPWPFADDQVDEMVFNHSLEHMGQDPKNFLGIIKEIYRICCASALVRINVPHPRHDWFIHDPTHVRVITPETMNLFSRKQNEHWKASGNSNTPLALYLGVDFELRNVQFGIEERYLNQLEIGALSEKELDQIILERNNVAKEILMTLEVVK